MSLLMNSLSHSFEYLHSGNRCKMLYILKMWIIYLVSIRVTSDVTERYLKK